MNLAGGNVLGVGVDLTEVDRIRSAHLKHGTAFLDKVFTPAEQKLCLAKADPYPSLAARFAAKEACSKALGTGFRKGVFWKDMGVVNEPSGKPTMVLTGGARAQLETLLPPGHKPRIHLTITDDFPYAHAVVMIEALPV